MFIRKEIKEERLMSTPSLSIEKPEERQPFKNRIPLNWDLVAFKDDKIEAINNITNERFFGTRKEFSKLLRVDDVE